MVKDVDKRLRAIEARIKPKGALRVCFQDLDNPEIYSFEGEKGLALKTIKARIKPPDLLIVVKYDRAASFRR